MGKLKRANKPKVNGRLKFAIVVIILILAFAYLQNNLVIPKFYVYSNTKLPKQFVGYKIAHISDINNTDRNLEWQLKLIKPDIIVLSGGYSDINGNYDKTIKVVKKLIALAPVYYIYNSKDAKKELEGVGAYNIVDKREELRPKEYSPDAFIIVNYGSENIDKDKKKEIKKELEDDKGKTISLYGLSNYDDAKSPEEFMHEAYKVIGKDTEGIKVVVNGLIRNIQALGKANIDLILTGGTFGKTDEKSGYSKGNYSTEASEVFISGGVSSDGGYRIFNLPELQVITLSDGSLKSRNFLENLLGRIIGDTGTIFDNDGGLKPNKRKY